MKVFAINCKKCGLENFPNLPFKATNLNETMQQIRHNKWNPVAVLYT